MTARTSTPQCRPLLGRNESIAFDPRRYESLAAYTDGRIGKRARKKKAERVFAKTMFAVSDVWTRSVFLRRRYNDIVRQCLTDCFVTFNVVVESDARARQIAQRAYSPCDGRFRRHTYFASENNTIVVNNEIKRLQKRRVRRQHDFKGLVRYSEFVFVLKNGAAGVRRSAT